MNVGQSSSTTSNPAPMIITRDQPKTGSSDTTEHQDEPDEVDEQH